MIDNFYVAIDLIDHQPPLTVHGIWAGDTPHNPRTRDHESEVATLKSLIKSI